MAQVTWQGEDCGFWQLFVGGRCEGAAGQGAEVGGHASPSCGLRWQGPSAG